MGFVVYLETTDDKESLDTECLQVLAYLGQLIILRRSAFCTEIRATLGYPTSYGGPVHQLQFTCCQTQNTVHDTVYLK